MRAMVYRGPYKVRMEEKERPAIEHPNDAIVRVQLAAICGSDLHLYHGMMPDTRIGHTFGHEFIGVVDEVGSSVRNLSVGDRVMVPFNTFCGTCWYCARGLYSNCHNVNPNATADTALAMESLRAVEATDAATVLPGHGEPWTEGAGSAASHARAVGEH